MYSVNEVHVYWGGGGGGDFLCKLTSPVQGE